MQKRERTRRAPETRVAVFVSWLLYGILLRHCTHLVHVLELLPYLVGNWITVAVIFAAYSRKKVHTLKFLQTNGGENQTVYLLKLRYQEIEQ